VQEKDGYTSQRKVGFSLYTVRTGGAALGGGAFKIAREKKYGFMPWLDSRYKTASVLAWWMYSSYSSESH